MHQTELAAAASRYLSEQDAALFLSESLPCVDLAQTANDRGAMQLGGQPSKFVGEWPIWSGKRLSFLCEIDLALVSAIDQNLSLPTAGLLSFFYATREQPWGLELQDHGSWRVIYTPPGEGSFHAEPEGVEVFDEVSLQARRSISGPWWVEPAIERIYDSDPDGLMRLMGSMETRGFHNGGHQLGGWPVWQQESYWRYAQLLTNGFTHDGQDGATDVLDGVDDWLLLLQLDGDDRSNWMWADGGTLYFLARKQDLADRNFDNVWMRLQC